MGEILLKVHDSYRYVVAICDKEFYGQKFEEENRQLDLTGPFFKGEEMTTQEVKEEIARHTLEDASFNIIGEKSIKVAVESGIVLKSGVGHIKGIPFALVLL